MFARHVNTAGMRFIVQPFFPDVNSIVVHESRKKQVQPSSVFFCFGCRAILSSARESISQYGQWEKEVFNDQVNKGG